jgi:hypothetical protein
MISIKHYQHVPWCTSTPTTISMVSWNTFPCRYRVRSFIWRDLMEFEIKLTFRIFSLVIKSKYCIYPLFFTTVSLCPTVLLLPIVPLPSILWLQLYDYKNSICTRISNIFFHLDCLVVFCFILLRRSVLWLYKIVLLWHVKYVLKRYTHTLTHATLEMRVLL